MTPENRQQLNAHVQAIAQLLYSEAQEASSTFNMCCHFPRGIASAGAGRIGFRFIQVFDFD